MTEIDASGQTFIETLNTFTGRQKAIDRLSQHLADPARLGAIGFVGKSQSGKTSLLHHFQRSAPSTDIMIYLDCAEQHEMSDQILIELIGKRSQVVVSGQGYLSTSVDEPHPPQEFDLRWAWLKDEHLPMLFNAIRANRRLGACIGVGRACDRWRRRSTGCLRTTGGVHLSAPRRTPQSRPTRRANASPSRSTE